MRAIFVLGPAVFFGAPLAILEPFVGFVVFVAFAGLGMQVTKPRPERGEGFGG